MQLTFRHCAILALVLSLTGCATFETGADHVRTSHTQHPVVTGMATAVVVGGIVYALDHHSNESAVHLQRGMPCDGHGETECRP